MLEAITIKENRIKHLVKCIQTQSCGLTPHCGYQRKKGGCLNRFNSVLGKTKGKDTEFEASLGYVVSSRSV
jgi:hypothetical protein